MTDRFERHREAVRRRLGRARERRAGPGSVSWKINREVVVVAGWGRAILLQLAHPAVAAGVRDHSAFRTSLLASVRRLHATVGAMLAITFGDGEQMVDAAAGINAVHDRVSGRVAEGAAETYTAHDPGVQRWVMSTLLESLPLTYELLVGPLSGQERDRYCAEAAIMEPLMGMPQGWLPRDAASLDAGLRAMRAGGRLVVSDSTRAIARAVLYPPKWYLAWPAFRLVQLVTIGTLPPEIRQAYGFRWEARDARALGRWTTLVRVLLPLVPRALREWPIARTGAGADLLRGLAPRAGRTCA